MPPLSLACHSARRRSLAIGPLTLRALEWGRPGQPPLLFLHGGSAHAHWFDQVVPAFVDRYHVLAPDQRGHGTSDWAADAQYSTAAFVTDLAGIMDRMDWPRMNLVGHSMGGRIAMAFAAEHPARVERLILIDSRGPFSGGVRPPTRAGTGAPRGHESIEAALRAFRLIPPGTVADRRLLEHLAREGLVRRGDRYFYRSDPGHSGQRRQLEDAALLARITAPTLLVRAEHSVVLTRETAGRMVEHLARASYTEIPGTHHHLMLDAPEAFTAVLDRFLAEPT